VCLGFFAVQSLVKIGLRYYCPRDAEYIRARRRAVARQLVRQGVPGTDGRQHA
jgi:hypothetical protein